VPRSADDRVITDCRTNAAARAASSVLHCVAVTQFRIADAARLLGVSDDTVRRWVDGGALAADTDASGRKVIAGAELAGFARAQAHATPDPSGVGRSARNRFVGLVTDIQSDTVMSQVEMQCGPHRVVSLMSTEAVQELALEVGSLAVAVIKATHIVVETPGGTA
jgi:molybdopterin-binding protein